MATKEALEVFLSSLDRKSYYDILRTPRDADAEAVQGAFHAFSLLYHPDCYGESCVRAVASEIYKRGVEAYRNLSRPETRARYDRALSRGKLRMPPFALSAPPSAPHVRTLETFALSAPPSAPHVRTLETVAQTARGKTFAGRADRSLAVGQLQDARAALLSACQCEPDNKELCERLDFLGQALALEPE